MAFSDFKSVFDVARRYQTALKRTSFLDEVATFPLPDWFMEDLNFSLRIKKPAPSEIAISENFISPLIRFSVKKHPNLNYWSREYDLKYDEELYGTPDYIFTYTESIDTLMMDFPLVCVAEAKIDNFVTAWGQTLAEMVACQKLFPDMIIYGFATNGETWQFGKLENNIFTQDEGTYSITENPTKIAGILDWIFTDAVKQAKKHLKIAF
jgi:hypothetical protein